MLCCGPWDKSRPNAKRDGPGRYLGGEGLVIEDEHGRDPDGEARIKLEGDEDVVCAIVAKAVEQDRSSAPMLVLKGPKAVNGEDPEKRKPPHLVPPRAGQVIGRAERLVFN